MTLEIAVEGQADDHPQLAELLEELERCAPILLEHLDLPLSTVVSLLLTDDPHTRALNVQWRGEDLATDVLSFPHWEPEQLEIVRAQPGMTLGDVVLNLDYLQRSLRTQGHRQRVADQLEIPIDELDWEQTQELVFLLVHAMLHLVGHDHGEPDEEAIMQAEERRLFVATMVA